VLQHQSVAAVDHLLTARASLERLAELLEDAVADGKAVSDIADEALLLVNDVRQVLDTIGDDEGTE